MINHFALNLKIPGCFSDYRKDIEHQYLKGIILRLKSLIEDSIVELDNFDN